MSSGREDYGKRATRLAPVPECQEEWVCSVGACPRTGEVTSQQLPQGGKEESEGVTQRDSETPPEAEGPAKSSQPPYGPRTPVSDDAESTSMFDMRCEEEAVQPHSRARQEQLQLINSQLREEDDKWQDDLARWKSRRRSASQDLIKKEEERKKMEKLLAGEDGTSERRKSIKTYREIVQEKERRERELHEAYKNARSQEEAEGILQQYIERFTISEAVLERLEMPKILERSHSTEPNLSSFLNDPNPMKYLRQQSLPPPKFTATVETTVARASVLDTSTPAGKPQHFTTTVTRCSPAVAFMEFSSSPQLKDDVPDEKDQKPEHDLSGKVELVLSQKERYQKEQDKLKEEWEKAQKEVEEEERRYYEEERKIIEDTVVPFTLSSSSADQLSTASSLSEGGATVNNMDLENGQDEDEERRQKKPLQGDGRDLPLKTREGDPLEKGSTLTQGVSAHSENPLPKGLFQDRQMGAKAGTSYCGIGPQPAQGAAMIIETLNLYFHIQCFRCGICKGQLGDAVSGTDVRIRNGLLNCNDCYLRSRSKYWDTQSSECGPQPSMGLDLGINVFPHQLTLRVSWHPDERKDNEMTPLSPTSNWRLVLQGGPFLSSRSK
ncbi:LIM and calponin homology domains-containing protein 1 [Tupaia chinensis]|uniref:LIM and calponin homology domains-containing protein 1 n=1 Tax=Tupaia chinensis TaxID=246437 RepID=L8Y7T7_TUPCH|nr:LIM and calponin homology domains-containing protein 1 [Tupaia chinensis]